MQNLEAVIKDHLYKEKYLSELVTNLNSQLQFLLQRD